MSEYDDQDYDTGHGGYGRASGASSYSGGGKIHDKTTNFTTTLIGEDGKFLFLKLDPKMAEQARTLFPTILTYLTEHADRLGTKKFGPKVGGYIGYGVALSEQIISTLQNIYDSAHLYDELRKAVRPLAKSGSSASHVAPLSGNNEVISTARAKISGLFRLRMTDTVIGTLSALPALAHHVGKQKTKNHELETLYEMEKARGNPDKLADVLEKEIKIGGMKTGMNAHDLEAATEKLIDRSRTAYKAKFEEFKTANERAVRKELTDALSITEDNVYSKIGDLKRLGVPAASRLDAQLNSSYGEEPNVKNLVDNFKRMVKGQDKRLLEDALAARFVKEHGAFDHSWKKYYQHGEERGYGSHSQQTPQTHKEKLEARIEELRKAQQKITEEEHGGGGKNKEFNTVIEGAKGLGAGMLSSVVRGLFGSKELEKFSQPIALDRILHLRRTLETAKAEPPELVPALPKSQDKEMSYVRCVHEIFQQHQKDCRRAEIGDRFTERFEKAHWDDAAIQQMSDDSLSAYEYGIKMIAKRIKDGRMDAIALVRLAGDRQKKIVHDDGRSFGPPGAGKDEAAVKAAIHRVVDEETALLNNVARQVEGKGNENLGNLLFSVEDLRNALQSNDLPVEERAFLFTSFTDLVGSDVKLCQQIGVDEKRCQELRNESKAHFSAHFDAIVSVLDEMVEANPKKLEALKLTDKEKELVHTLAGRLLEKGKDVADLTENRDELKALETVVLNATMVLGKEKSGENGEAGFWTKIVEKARALPQKLKERKQAADAAGDMDETPRSRNPEVREMDRGFDRDDDSREAGRPGSFADRLDPAGMPASARERLSRRGAESAEGRMVT